MNINGTVCMGKPEYKAGDKAIVEIKEVEDKDDMCGDEPLLKIGTDWIDSEEVIDKYNEPSKIKFTQEEANDFYEFCSDYGEQPLYKQLSDLRIFYDNHSKRYNALTSKLFEGYKSELITNQENFALAIKHPELIKIIKPKKYAIKLLDGFVAMTNDGYYTIAHDLIAATKFNEYQVEELKTKKQFGTIDIDHAKKELINF